LRYDYSRDGNGVGGSGSLYVNGKLVGTAHFDDMVVVSLDNFDIGKDSASPVSQEYTAPFAFSGTLEKVTVTLE